MRASLLSQLCVSLLVSSAISASPEKVPSSPSSSASEVTSLSTSSKAQDATIKRYAGHSLCAQDLSSSFPASQEDAPPPLSQSLASFTPDTCHAHNPHLTESILILSPALCPSGSRAVLSLFTSSLCVQTDPIIPALTYTMSDSDLNTCIDVRGIWSFAFICDGLPEAKVPWWSGWGVYDVLATSFLTFFVCMMITFLFVPAWMLEYIGSGLWAVGRMWLGVFSVKDLEIPRDELAQEVFPKRPDDDGPKVENDGKVEKVE